MPSRESERLPATPLPPETAVSHNAQRLFSLFERLHLADDDPTAVYYTVAWNPENPTYLEDVTTVTLVPTGARRQESFANDTRGQFAQAQFIATETSDLSDTSTERFIWCFTGNTPALEPAIVDPNRLARDFGYQEMSPANLVATLASRLEGVDQHIELMRAVNGRGIPVQKELIKRMRSLTYRLVNKALEHPVKGALTTDPTGEQMFEAISFMQQSSPDKSKQLEGQIVGQLLRRLSPKWGKYNVLPEEEVRDTEILDTFEAAFQQGILPQATRILTRIVHHPAIYRRPYLEKLIAKNVLSDKHHSSSMMVLGVRRTVFAHTYIAATLDARMHALKGVHGKEIEDIREVLSRTHQQSNISDERRATSYVFLFNLAERLGYQSALYAHHTSSDRQRYPVERYTEVGAAYGFILRKLDELYPGFAQPELNEARVQLINAVLAPRLEIAIEQKQRAEAKEALQNAKEAAKNPKR